MHLFFCKSTSAFEIIFNDFNREIMLKDGGKKGVVNRYKKFNKIKKTIFF